MKRQHETTKKPITYFNTDQPVEIPATYQSKPVRAMWVSNVLNIDLPVIAGDGESYKNQILTMLDTCEQYNINTIYFQVRTTNDAFYQSKLNPYSRFFTGKEGTKPPFDVLAWIIEECHQRGIAIHGWCNPYRVSADGTLSVDEYLATCDDKNFAKQHPEYLVLDTKGKLILNPAIPEVQQFIIDSMIELVESYHLDGIHFDDYFYPYSDFDPNHDDKNEFEQRNDKEESLGDFRRRQVDTIIAGVYKAIKACNPSLQFGVSPFGIWKNKTENMYGSNTGQACGQTYFNQYADSVKWVKEGMLDYVVPQIYWSFEHPIAPFADIVDFWVDVVKDTTVDLYIGHGAYRLGTINGWVNPNEIVDQLKYANQYDEVKGNVFFTYHTFIDQEKIEAGMNTLQTVLTEVDV